MASRGCVSVATRSSSTTDPPGRVEPPSYGDTARRAALTTLVALAVIVGAMALWKLKVLIALLFAAITLAAAMRPGVEWLYKRRVPRAAGVAIHYLVLLGL